MAGPQRKLATYADLQALPADTRAEVRGGDGILSPARLPRHSKAQGSARRFLGGPFDDDDGHGGPGGWWIFVEVDVQLSPHDVVRPDYGLDLNTDGAQNVLVDSLLRGKLLSRV